MKTARASLRLFEELVIGFLNRIYYDLFLRTEVFIVTILFFLCFLYLTIIIISTHYLQLEIASLVVHNITESITSNTLDSIATGEKMFTDINSIRNLYLLITGGISLITTILFGYLTARIALRPAKNALQTQKQFIGNLAHELRTSLSILRANHEVALLENKNSPDEEDTLTSNIEEIDRISSIINNLLSFNSLSRPEQIVFDSVDFLAVVQETIQKFTLLAEKKNVSITLHSSEPFLAWGNKSALEQVVINLLKNAIAYTKPSGTIQISLEQLPLSRGRFEISDTGIGIEKEKLARIFEPFYRTDSARTRDSGGSGLGLAIVSELVKLHHGKIIVKSAPGVGTTVYIELPTVTVLDEKNPTLSDEIIRDFSVQK